MKEKDKHVVITGVICITLLELLALSLGFNGFLLRAVLVAIAAAIGITIPTPKIMKK